MHKLFWSVYLKTRSRCSLGRSPAAAGLLRRRLVRVVDLGALLGRRLLARPAVRVGLRALLGGGVGRVVVAELTLERDVGEGVVQVDLLGAGGDVEILVELREGRESESVKRSSSKVGRAAREKRRTEMPPSWLTSTSLMTFLIVASSTSE